MKYDPSNAQQRLGLAVLIDAKLTAAGFRLQTSASKEVSDRPSPPTFEDVYEFAIPQRPGVFILVYSTIEKGSIRSYASDAIRVMAIYKRRDGGVRMLFEGFRVFRTGEPLDIAGRVADRARETWLKIREHHRDPKYTCHCGGFKFISKNNTLHCAETCWVK